MTDVIAGTYSATADYGGDTNYGSSTGQDTAASISKAQSSTGVTDTAAGVATGGSFSFSRPPCRDRASRRRAQSLGPSPARTATRSPALLPHSMAVAWGPAP